MGGVKDSLAFKYESFVVRRIFFCRRKNCGKGFASREALGSHEQIHKIVLSTLLRLVEHKVIVPIFLFILEGVR
jgi:hypothetical protein